MSRDIQDVIDSADNPKISVLVPSRSVAGEIVPFELAPVLFLITLLVAVNGAQHRRPGFPDNQLSAHVWPDLPAFFVHDGRINAEEWQRSAARFCGNGTG